MDFSKMENRYLLVINIYLKNKQTVENLGFFRKIKEDSFREVNKGFFNAIVLQKPGTTYNSYDITHSSIHNWTDNILNPSEFQLPKKES